MSNGDPQRVNYNCVCDEYVALQCSNEGCSNEIRPDASMVVTPEGAVFCSESCVQ